MYKRTAYTTEEIAELEAWSDTLVERLIEVDHIDEYDITELPGPREVLA